MAQEAMKFRDPRFIHEAVVTVTHIQDASRILGNQGGPTAQQVYFDDKPTTEAPSTDMDLLMAAPTVRDYRRSNIHDACYTCGGSGHRSRECATRNRATATCYSCGGIGHYYVQTACIAHHHGNDLAVRRVPSGHYNVYGDTLLRDQLGVIPGQTNIHRQAAM